jgi:hypothetical protein
MANAAVRQFEAFNPKCYFKGPTFVVSAALLCDQLSASMPSKTSFIHEGLQNLGQPPPQALLDCASWRR